MWRRWLRRAAGWCYRAAAWCERTAAPRWSVFSNGFAYRGVALTKGGPPWRAVLRRDPCAYCGGPAGTIDHIRPTGRGGRNGWQNETSACERCNNAKADRTLLLWLVSRARTQRPRKKKAHRRPGKPWKVAIGARARVTGRRNRP
ncbi:MAG: HNH endonuclease [Vicinamibacterales bacterium]